MSVAGFIYILENQAYGPFVVKIGLSKRTPDIRAREIYAGATGVPMPFDIAKAFTVADCKVAEKRIHKRIAAYRLNNRREFFRISPKVAAVVAKETCAQINEELGASPSEEIDFPPKSLSTSGRRVSGELDDEGYDPLAEIWVDIKRLVESPVGTCALTPEQLDRAYILHMNLSLITGIAEQTWFETFTQDSEPERELRVWETIAKAFLRIDGIDVASVALKHEAYSLLLQRSWSSTEEVLKNAVLKHMPRAAAKRLLDGYKLKPKPFLIKTLDAG